MWTLGSPYVRARPTVAAMFWAVVVTIMCGLQAANTPISSIQSSGAASLNIPPLVERRLFATVLVNARMISFRCFSLIRTLYSIDIVLPHEGSICARRGRGHLAPNIQRNFTENLTYVLFGEM